MTTELRRRDVAYFPSPFSPRSQESTIGKATPTTLKKGVRRCSGRLNMQRSIGVKTNMSVF